MPVRPPPAGEKAMVASTLHAAGVTTPLEVWTKVQSARAGHDDRNGVGSTARLIVHALA